MHALHSHIHPTHKHSGVTPSCLATGTKYPRRTCSQAIEQWIANKWKAWHVLGHEIYYCLSLEPHRFSVYGMYTIDFAQCLYKWADRSIGIRLYEGVKSFGPQLNNLAYQEFGETKWLWCVDMLHRHKMDRITDSYSKLYIHWMKIWTPKPSHRGPRPEGRMKQCDLVSSIIPPNSCKTLSHIFRINIPLEYILVVDNGNAESKQQVSKVCIDTMCNTAPRKTI